MSALGDAVVRRYKYQLPKVEIGEKPSHFSLEQTVENCVQCYYLSFASVFPR